MFSFFNCFPNARFFGAVFAPENPTLSTSQRVKLLVDDVNDNAPKLSSGDVTVTLSPAVRRNEKIMEMTATDADLGRNGNVYYRIIEPVHRRFHIDTLTGEILSVFFICSPTVY